MTHANAQQQSGSPPAMSRGASVTAARAKDIMTKRVLTLHPGATVAQGLARLVQTGHSGMPVIDDRGNALGIFSEHDCVQLLLSDRHHYEESMHALRVGEVMTEIRASADPESDIFLLTSLFVEARVRRIPILQGQRLAGIVSRRDLVEAIQQDIERASPPRERS